ncbi:MULTISPECIES: hypothetical protein [unclassified Streptomyces]|uniref:hypothetical protein n=1 Tax=unclassified Streptomyces TaxID=2593676 RepID=UPI0016512073|nr:MULTISPECIES: hypothetical protein [unclassified Streptomyces]
MPAILSSAAHGVEGRAERRPLTPAQGVSDDQAAGEQARHGRERAEPSAACGDGR